MTQTPPESAPAQTYTPAEFEPEGAGLEHVTADEAAAVEYGSAPSVTPTTDPTAVLGADSPAVAGEG